MTRNPKLDFCQRFVHLQGERIRFAGRPYLPAIYASQGRNVVLRASRQVEKSTFLVNTLVFELCRQPRISILLVCPRWEQAWVFMQSRLLPALRESPLVRRKLLGNTTGRPKISHVVFDNQSQLFVRAAYHNADSSRGISADLLVVDEVQDIAAGDLPVLQETLSHSQMARTILTGTPKLIENHLEAAFARSTANEWTIQCPGCSADVILDEQVLGLRGIECHACQQPLDPATGRWVARNPDSNWGDGYWINHLMVPWVNYDAILERRSVYDLAKFKNEVLGLSTTLGEHVVTRAELEACCSDRPKIETFESVPRSVRDRVIAGIDWGGGVLSRTVVVIGWMRSDFVFEIGAFYRFRADEDPNSLLDAVADICRKLQVRFLVADGGGNGLVYNRLLLDRLKHLQNLRAVLYSTADQQPRQDGVLWKWTVNRSASIGALFARVRKRILVFPRREDCSSYLDEFACELVDYDEMNRTVRYTHPASMHDDALHAANYALLLGIQLHHAQSAAY